MPFGFSRAGFHGRRAGIPYQLIDTMVGALRTNRDLLRNLNFYAYTLDGDSTFISDGTGDMYDGGNFTNPALRSGIAYTGNSGSSGSFPFRVSYAATATSVVDTDFYFASIGYSQQTAGSGIVTTLAHPLTVIGTRSGVGASIGWQIGGNAGADGASGSIGTSYAYNGTLLNGFTTYAWYRQISGAGDPSICNLFLLLGHSNWSSVFGGITTGTVNNTDFCAASFFTSGPNVKNIVAITSLLSRQSGIAVTHGQIVNIVNNYTSILKTALGY
jgi:hypothetical protein